MSSHIFSALGSSLRRGTVPASGETAMHLTIFRYTLLNALVDTSLDHAVRIALVAFDRALSVFKDYIEKRMKFPFFSNARTVSAERAEG